jgi:leucine dehydrogenase
MRKPVFDHPDFDAHEQVVFTADPDTGLQTIIAIHDTTLGPALGGCRIRDYADEDEALADVLRLSRGMSYKAALAGLALGGGKAVVITAPDRPKTPAMMQAMGRAVGWLGGRYITAEDVGSSVEDMEAIATATPHVAGRASGGDVGDPSPYTARGVFLCLEEAVRLRHDRGLRGVHVTVKGLGHVGHALAGLLHEAGARLTVADIDPARVAAARTAFAAETASVEAIAEVPADVYAPCALGGDLSEAAIPRLGAGIVCGAANNQLATEADGTRLQQRGILYCPDYLVNAGGLISVARRPLRLSADEVAARLAALPGTLRQILLAARRDGRTPGAVADALARARFRPDAPQRLSA